MAALGTVLQRGLDGVPLALAKPAKPAPETGLQIGMGAVVTGVSRNPCDCGPSFHCCLFAPLRPLSWRSSSMEALL